MNNPDSIAGYKVHPAANLFPLMSSEALRDLTDDIKAKGLILPIMLWHEQILDGRNRLLACESAKVQPRFEIYSDDRSPTEYVITINTKRRHLTAGQLAMIGKEAEKLFAIEAKERQKKLALAREADKRGEPEPERIPELDKGEARQKAAAALGVNPHYITDAKKIADESPELAEQVAKGEKTIPKALKEIKDQKEKEKPITKRYKPADGLMYADMAVCQLKKIHTNDIQRDEGFEYVLAWISKHRGEE